MILLLLSSLAYGEAQFTQLDRDWETKNEDVSEVLKYLYNSLKT